MSMPNHVKTFPREYDGGRAQRIDLFTEEKGDPEITALWAEYRKPGVNTTTWTFRKKVIACAKRLLTNNRNVFTRTDGNPLVVEYNYKFLLDTIRYIGTGKRQISIHAWPDLLTHLPKKTTADVRDRHDIEVMMRDVGLSTSADTMIQMWCSHKGGFDDMVSSLNLMFGDIKLRTAE